MTRDHTGDNSSRRAMASPCAPRLGGIFKKSLLAVQVVVGLSTAMANPVADWNELFTGCIAKECHSPALASRNLATFHLAIASAMESTRGGAEEKSVLAAAAAASSVGTMLFSGQAAKFRSLLPERAWSAEEVELTEIGKKAAAAAMELRRGDSTSTTVNYHTSGEPGEWQRTCSRPPELPHWPNVHPLIIENTHAFLPPPPPSLVSPEYAKALREVQTCGAADSIERTPEQTMIAKFWSDFSYTSTPPGHWNEVARFLVRKNQMDAFQASRLFAALNVAMADVSIVCWDAKYHYNFWRPVTAIHGADADGNPSTHGYAEWKPLLKTPPHPEYVSGHAAFSGAAAKVMKAFYPEANRFSVKSETVPGVTREYDSFDACASEIVESRVYGGIHFRFSGERGLALGRDVAGVVLQRLDSKKVSEIVQSNQIHP